MSKVRTAVGEGNEYQHGTWSTLPLWAALALIDQRPELAKRVVFWEWMPLYPDSLSVHTDNACWFVNKSDRVVW